MIFFRFVVFFTVLHLPTVLIFLYYANVFPFTFWIWWDKLVVCAERRKASTEYLYLLKMSQAMISIITCPVLGLLFQWAVSGRRLQQYQVLYSKHCVPSSFVSGIFFDYKKRAIVWCHVSRESRLSYGS